MRSHLYTENHVVSDKKLQGLILPSHVKKISSRKRKICCGICQQNEEQCLCSNCANPLLQQVNVELSYTHVKKRKLEKLLDQRLEDPRLILLHKVKALREANRLKKEEIIKRKDALRINLEKLDQLNIDLSIRESELQERDQNLKAEMELLPKRRPEEGEAMIKFQKFVLKQITSFQMEKAMDCFQQLHSDDYSDIFSDFG